MCSTLSCRQCHQSEVIDIVHISTTTVDRNSFRIFDLPSFYLDTLYTVSFTFTYTLPCGFTLHGRIRMTYFLRLMPRPHRQGIEEFGSIEIVEGPTLCYCDDFSQLLEF